MSIKKLANISQHSSLSQADDVSSPYARVKSPSHAYDKVRQVEHPYAQLKAGPSSSALEIQPPSNPPVPTEDTNTLSRHTSNQNLLDNVDGRLVIPAASAIAGRISASQELPYMTPPIVQAQHHFSGDSQDSSSKLFKRFYYNKINIFIIFKRDTRVSVCENLWQTL